MYIKEDQKKEKTILGPGISYKCLRYPLPPPPNYRSSIHSYDLDPFLCLRPVDIYKFTVVSFEKIFFTDIQINKWRKKNTDIFSKLSFQTDNFWFSWELSDISFFRFLYLIDLRLTIWPNTSCLYKQLWGTFSTPDPKK